MSGMTFNEAIEAASARRAERQSREEKASSVLASVRRRAEAEVEDILSTAQPVTSGHGNHKAALGGLTAKACELASRIEALSVKAVDQVGHAFRGNQYRKQGTVHSDPAGVPAGKIMSAILVIGGKRYRGPSHFQALMAYGAANPKLKGLPAVPEDKQGFETESGHFLNREDAAEYALKHKLIAGQEEKHEAEHTGSLKSEGLMLAAVDGSLYTQDAVQAEHKSIEEAFAAHDAARDGARAEYQKAVAKTVSVLEAEALTAAAAAKTEEERKKKEKRRKELLAALALLLLLAGVRAYRAIRPRLSALLPGLGYRPSHWPTAPTGQPGEENVPAASPDAFPATLEADAEAFADERADLLVNFPEEALDRLDRAAEEARQGLGEDEADKAMVEAIHDTGSDILAGKGQVVADTEAQATYGNAMMRLLQQAGFAEKVWSTMEDDRVRESHVECGNQGPVPMDKPFANGLMYPGDPRGGPEETCGCRCWLTGGRRKPGTGHLKASEPFAPQKHPRDPHGRWAHTWGASAPMPGPGGWTKDDRAKVTSEHLHHAADWIQSLPEHERGDTEFYGAVLRPAIQIHEARRLAPKDVGAKFKRAKDWLDEDYSHVANISGHLIGLNQEEDPDDEDKTIWTWERLDDPRRERFETYTDDRQQAYDHIRHKLIGAKTLKQVSSEEAAKP